MHGGAEVHVRELVRELRARGYDAELVSVPFKWYPKEEILPHAAAWRLLDLSESNGRPIDLGDRDEVPDLLRAAPEQGRVADSPVPRRLRAVRHDRTAISRTRRVGRRPARHADPPRHRDARRVPAHLHERAEHREPRLRKFNGLAAEPLYHPPRLAARLAAAARYGDYVLSVGRIESVKRVDLLVSRDGSRSIRRSGWSSPATGRSARTSERVARTRGRRRSRHVPRRGRRRRAARAVSRARWRCLSAVRRGLRLRHARGVPGAQAGRHRDRFRRAERVRRRRRERLRAARRSPRRSPTAINALAARPAARGGAGRRRVRRAREQSPGTA